MGISTVLGMPPRVDRNAYVPAYAQLAAILRERIAAGEYRPGEYVPSEPRLGQEFELGVLTVRKAMAVLRAEGLVETERGVGSRVRDRKGVTVVKESAGARVAGRLATADDFRRHGIPEGVQVLVVSRDGAEDKVFRADEAVIEFDAEL
jgi:DNA-binding transcriptional regulator YhcF (GntR family)